jgi:hypothetical protein
LLLETRCFGVGITGTRDTCRLLIFIRVFFSVEFLLSLNYFSELGVFIDDTRLSHQVGHLLPSGIADSWSSSTQVSFLVRALSFFQGSSFVVRSLEDHGCWFWRYVFVSPSDHRRLILVYLISSDNSLLIPLAVPQLLAHHTYPTIQRRFAPSLPRISHHYFAHSIPQLP